MRRALCLRTRCTSLPIVSETNRNLLDIRVLTTVCRGCVAHAIRAVNIGLAKSTDVYTSRNVRRCCGPKRTHGRWRWGCSTHVPGSVRRNRKVEELDLAEVSAKAVFIVQDYPGGDRPLHHKSCMLHSSPHRSNGCTLASIWAGCHDHSSPRAGRSCCPATT